MKYRVLILIIYVGIVLCSRISAQNSNVNIYSHCVNPTPEVYYCSSDCGGTSLNLSMEGSDGPMDLTDPTECYANNPDCQMPTEGNGIYLAIPDTQFGCGGSECDPNDITGSVNTTCKNGYYCESTTNTCLPNGSTGSGGCIYTDKTGCASNSSPSCCSPSDVCVAGSCRSDTACGSITDLNCPTATCNYSTNQWDESNCQNSYPCGSAYDPDCDVATCDISTGSWDIDNCLDQACSGDNECDAYGGNCMCDGSCGVSLDQGGTGCNCDGDCAGTLVCDLDTNTCVTDSGGGGGGGDGGGSDCCETNPCDCNNNCGSGNGGNGGGGSGGGGGYSGGGNCGGPGQYCGPGSLTMSGVPEGVCCFGTCNYYGSGECPMY